jgi:hypothetical protein
MIIKPRKNDWWDWDLEEYGWWDVGAIWTGHLRAELLGIEMSVVPFPYWRLKEELV